MTLKRLYSMVILCLVIYNGHNKTIAKYCVQVLCYAFFCQKVICRGLSCFLYLAIFIEVKCHRDTYLSPHRDARPLLRTREWFRSLDTDVNLEDGVWGRSFNRPRVSRNFTKRLPHCNTVDSENVGSYLCHIANFVFTSTQCIQRLGFPNGKIRF